MIYHAPAHVAMAQLADESQDVLVFDPPYNTGNTANKVEGYDQSESIVKQKWKNFYAGWDAIDDMAGFTNLWLDEARRVLKPSGSLFVFGSHHNIPITDICLKQQKWWVNQWISWCIPNAFPQRKMIQQVSSNQVIIHARKGKSQRHVYNVERAKDYAALDYWRRTGRLPITRTNLRDFWLINNDSRAVKQFPFLVHGAKKPPEVVARCIDIALPEEGGAVFDAFLGSGTTLYTSKYLNDWIVTPRATLPTYSGSELYIEYARMCEMRCEMEIKPLEGGLSLPNDARMEIRKEAGDWADYILDQQLRPMLIPELVRLWDAPRPMLKRPGIVQVKRKPNISEQQSMLSFWQQGENNDNQG